MHKQFFFSLFCHTLGNDDRKIHNQHNSNGFAEKLEDPKDDFKALKNLDSQTKTDAENKDNEKAAKKDGKVKYQKDSSRKEKNNENEPEEEMEYAWPDNDYEDYDYDKDENFPDDVPDNIEEFHYDQYLNDGMTAKHLRNRDESEDEQNDMTPENEEYEEYNNEFDYSDGENYDDIEYGYGDENGDNNDETEDQIEERENKRKGSSEKDDEESNSEISKDKLPEQNDNSEDGEESAVKYDGSDFEDDEDYEDYDENYDDFEEHPEEEQSNEGNQKKREKGIVIYGKRYSNGRLNMVI